MTAERASTILAQVQKLRELRAKQDAAFLELEQATVAALKLEPVYVGRQPFITQRTKRCARCGARFDGAHVWEFEGRYWHTHNCGVRA